MSVLGSPIHNMPSTSAHTFLTYLANKLAGEEENRPTHYHCTFFEIIITNGPKWYKPREIKYLWVMLLLTNRPICAVYSIHISSSLYWTHCDIQQIYRENVAAIPLPYLTVFLPNFRQHFCRRFNLQPRDIVQWRRGKEDDNRPFYRFLRVENFLLLSKYFFKHTKCGAKIFNSRKFRNKIKLWSSHNSLCRKFADVWWKTANCLPKLSIY